MTSVQVVYLGSDVRRHMWEWWVCTRKASMYWWAGDHCGELRLCPAADPQKEWLCGTHLRIIPLRDEEAAGGFIHQLLSLVYTVTPRALALWYCQPSLTMGHTSWDEGQLRGMWEAFGLEGDWLQVTNLLVGSGECEQGSGSIHCNNHESFHHMKLFLRNSYR